MYDEETETWFFSVVDIVQGLTEQSDFQTARKYWNKLKTRLKAEGSELVTNCHRLKLTAQDGKKIPNRRCRCRNPPSPRPVCTQPQSRTYQALAGQGGDERIQEMAAPEIVLNRSRALWQQHGRSKKWIGQRMLGQETRNNLTDYWKDLMLRKGGDMPF